MQMRQTVSLFCGMSSSIGGVISGLIGQHTDAAGKDLNGEDVSLIRNLSTFQLLGDAQNSVNVGMTNLDVKLNNYNIQFDKKGNVTILARNVVKMQLNSYYANEKPKQFYRDACPVVGAKEITVKIFIKNQADSELNGRMPEFEIQDFSQKEYVLPKPGKAK